MDEVKDFMIMIEGDWLNLLGNDESWYNEQFQQFSKMEDFFGTKIFSVFKASKLETRIRIDGFYCAQDFKNFEGDAENPKSLFWFLLSRTMNCYSSECVVLDYDAVLNESKEL